MSKLDKPLVSVIIITYKQEAIICETLDSIRAQTYPRMELIISDDCSPDGTADVCREWLGRNVGAFERAELVTAAKNTGTCGNINRGLEAARGEWVKILAGDDLLVSEAIEEFVRFCVANNFNFAGCRMNEFGENPKLCEEQRAYDEKMLYPIMRASYKKQRETIQRRLFIPGPAVFYKRSLLDAIGGFDEHYMFNDEWPTFYRIIMGGNPLGYIDAPLVYYRVAESSVCHNVNEDIGYSYRVFVEDKKFYYNVLLWNDLKNMRFFRILDKHIYFSSKTIMRKTPKNSALYVTAKYLYRLSPLTWWKKLKKLLHMPSDTD